MADLEFREDAGAARDIDGPIPGAEVDDILKQVYAARKDGREVRRSATEIASARPPSPSNFQIRGLHHID
jgi:hypothetical protein